MNDVIGAAVFDLSGLPKEYFTIPDNSNMSWVQTIFQALGLRSLLMSSLKLEGFNYVTVYGSEYCAIVVKQRNYYIALLLNRQVEEVSTELVEWAQQFEPDRLRNDPRFQAA